jgi:hypothetical protein
MLLQAGLGQGRLDYSKRNARIQGKIYSGNMFKGNRQTTSQPQVQYDYSSNQARVSRYSHNRNSQVQASRFPTKNYESKRSFWDKFKAPFSSKRRDTRTYQYSGGQHYRDKGLTFGQGNQFSKYNNTVRLQNPEKNTRRISSGDINKFIDPRAQERNRPAQGKNGYIQVQGPGQWSRLR